MATAPKYQVFISSTFEDLKDERDQVIKAVLEMGHIPVGMEMFSAADEQQWQIIARHIDQSDYYAVIVAHRLGSMTPEGVSYTRKEYEYARDRGIPCLGFVIDAAAHWPADRVETSPSQTTGLAEFKGLIQEKPVSYWSSAEDLHGKFSIALMKSFTAQPREGWVRASDVDGGPQAAAELVRLSAENGELRKKLALAEASAAHEKQEERKRTFDILFDAKRSLSYRYSAHGEWQHDATCSLFDLFEWMGSEMVVESAVEDVAGILAMNLRVDKDKPWDIVAVNQVKELLADFLTLDLVRPSNRKHPVSDVKDYWSLSEFGLDVLKQVRKARLARPKAQPEPETSQTTDGEVDSVGSGDANSAVREDEAPR